MVDEPKQETIDLSALCAARYPRIVAPGYAECGPGWNRLLADLCASLSAVLATTKAGTIRVDQVKEKYGGLRFYFQDHDVARRPSRRLEAIVSVAEDRASHTCETCGAPGVLRNSGGWVFTACDEHSRGNAPARRSDTYERSRSNSRVRWMTEEVRFDPERGAVVVTRRTERKKPPIRRGKVVAR